MRPERVVLEVGMDVSSSGAGGIVEGQSMYAGFRWSMLTVEGLVWISMVKCLGVRFNTLKGPS